MPVDLSHAAVAPPRSARAARASVTKATGKLGERREALEGVAQLTGFGLVVFKQYADAGAIGMHADPIIGELVALSDKNEKIAHALDYLTEAGPYAGLVIACMPLVMQLMANHGIVKAEMVAGSGVVPPQVLESQVKADMMRQAAAALQAQNEAEAELRRMTAAMTPQDASEGQPEANGQTHAPASPGRKSART